jgi:hypothetical protein
MSEDKHRYRPRQIDASSLVGTYTLTLGHSSPSSSRHAASAFIWVSSAHHERILAARFASSSERLFNEIMRVNNHHHRDDEIITGGNNEA